MVVVLVREPVEESFIVTKLPLPVAEMLECVPVAVSKVPNPSRGQLWEGLEDMRAEGFFSRLPLRVRLQSRRRCRQARERNRVVILEIKRQRYSKLTARHLGLGENHRPELN